MVKKLGKVLCFMFLFAILEVDSTQNRGKIQKVVMCTHTTTNQ